MQTSSANQVGHLCRNEFIDMESVDYINMSERVSIGASREYKVSNVTTIINSHMLILFYTRHCGMTNSAEESVTFGPHQSGPRLHELTEHCAATRGIKTTTCIALCLEEQR